MPEGDTNPKTMPSYGGSQPHLVVQPTYQDEDTGAVYVHKDLRLAIEPWATEQHVGPVKEVAKLGDVESWAEYIKRYGEPILPEPEQQPAGTDALQTIAPDAITAATQNSRAAQETFITWNSHGLKAILDYHKDESPGRCQWVATYDFQQTPQFRDWSQFADGEAVSQREAVEFLEDHWPDILTPDQATLIDLLRNLRANSTANAETRLNPDGTANISFQKATQVRAEGDVTLPSEMEIQVPVLKGHVDDKGAPVIYKLVVKVRATVDGNAHLVLRFTMPQVQIVLDQVTEEIVGMAKAALGDDYTILRAAG